MALVCHVNRFPFGRRESEKCLFPPRILCSIHSTQSNNFILGNNGRKSWELSRVESFSSTQFFEELNRILPPLCPNISSRKLYPFSCSFFFFLPHIVFTLSPLANEAKGKNTKKNFYTVQFT